MTDWDGKERRENWYCPQHSEMQDVARKSVPRWAFIAAMSAMVTVSLGFASWQITSLNEIQKTIDHRLTEIQNLAERRATETQRLTEERTRTVKESYLLDVGRFYRVAEENRQLLMTMSKEIAEIRIKQGQIETFQSMVLKKVKIADEK